MMDGRQYSPEDRGFYRVLPEPPNVHPSQGLRPPSVHSIPRRPPAPPAQDPSQDDSMPVDLWELVNPHAQEPYSNPNHPSRRAG